MFSFAFPTFILSLALAAFADLVPLEPNPGNLFKEGSNITASWTPDTNTAGPWKVMNIQLMTGNNLAMIPLTTLATVDGTASPSTFTFTCPPITIHSAIYFLQFSCDATHVLWTGRFTITDASGTTVPPPNATQPNGQPIPWGAGALVDPATAKPPPSYLPGGSASSSNASSVMPVSGAGSSASSSTVTPSSSSGVNTPLAVVPSSITNTTSGTPTDSQGAASTGNSDKSSGSNSNGALVLSTVSTRAAKAGVALAVVAGTITFVM